MPTEPVATAAALYTLDEARLELARQECAQLGHSWDVVQTVAAPTAVVCRRCPASHRVVPGTE